MEYVFLDAINSDLKLKTSRIGFGCEPLGGEDWGNVDILEIENAIEEAIDHGWTYFDTAEIYGLGLSERRLSKFIRSHKNKNLVIGTKVGLAWTHFNSLDKRAKINVDGSPKSLYKSVHASLSRLSLEAIPLVFLHYPDPKVPLEDSLGALEDMTKEGKILAIGVSNFNTLELEKALSITKICAVQVECSALNLKNELSSNSSLAWCKSRRIPIFGYGTLARGLMTGKFLDQIPYFEKNDRRRRLAEFKGELFMKNQSKVREWGRLAKEMGVPMSALAIRFVLDVFGIDVAITGIKSNAQLKQNNIASDLMLDTKYISKIFENFDY